MFHDVKNEGIGFAGTHRASYDGDVCLAAKDFFLEALLDFEAADLGHNDLLLVWLYCPLPFLRILGT